MIESLAEHGVQASDLVPSLMTTHTIANPEYDPIEARRLEEERSRNNGSMDDEDIQDDSESDSQTLTELVDSSSYSPITPVTAKKTTANVLQPSMTTAMPGVSTTLSPTDANVTLDIRWTILCDLFLLIIADSVYDSRSRVLLEMVALKLGLGWLDVVKFEKRVTDALEIQEGVEKMEQQDIIEGRMKAARKKRYMMMGLATLGMYRNLLAFLLFQQYFRWWSRYWLIGRIVGASDWSRVGCCIHNNRCHWNNKLFCWSWRRGTNYHRWSSHWFRNRS